MTPEETARIASIVLENMNEIKPSDILVILQTAGAAVKARIDADLNEKIQAEVLNHVRGGSPIPEMINETVH